MSILASVYIICRNEEKNIRRALESIREFDDIVIVDSGSSDATLTIAKEYPCRIHEQTFLGYAAQKRFAMSLCKHDWALNLDADEELTPALREEIVKLMADPKGVTGLQIPFRDTLLGRTVHPYTKQIRHLRFFRRSCAHYPETSVHEGVLVSGEVRPAQGVIRHYGGSSIAALVDKNNRYSQLRAADKAARHKRPKVVKLVFMFPVMFFKSYLLRRNCLNGWRGFVASMINAFYAFLKEAKLFELTAEKPEVKDQTAPNFSPSTPPRNDR